VRTIGTHTCKELLSLVVFPEGKTGEFDERQFYYPLCVDHVARGYDKYFPGEWTRR